MEEKQYPHPDGNALRCVHVLLGAMNQSHVNVSQNCPGNKDSVSPTSHGDLFLIRTLFYDSAFFWHLSLNHLYS